MALISDETGAYPFHFENRIIDQRPIIEMIIDDLKTEVPKEIIAKKFHNTIVKIIIDTAEVLRRETSILSVVLSGGVFQNTILLENAFTSLKERGFTPLIHQLVPPNDGGISLGQAVYSQFM